MTVALALEFLSLFARLKQAILAKLNAIPAAMLGT